MERQSSREPIFNVPAVVAVMVGVLVLVHVLIQESGDFGNAILMALAFIPDRYSAHGLAWPGGVVSTVTSPLTYQLVHGDVTHLTFNAVSLLAFGALVARRLGAFRFKVFALLCGVCGAFAFLLMNPGLQSPLIGASGAVSGLMAAALRLLFSAIDQAPPGFAGELLRRLPGRIAVAPLAFALRDRRLLVATAVWLMVNALAAYGLGTPADAGVVAWEAHLGGYFAGLFGLGAFDPGQEASQSADDAGEGSA